MARVMTNVVSVRVPAEWKGRITSEQVREWALEYVSDPFPLQEVPAPGSYRLSIRLSQGEFSALLRVSRRSMSSTIRGIIALNVSLPPKSSGWGWLRTMFAIAFLLLGLVARFRAAVGQERENDQFSS